MFVYNSQYNKRNYPQNHIPQGYSPAVMLWVNSFITTHTNTDLLNAVEASVWTHPTRKPQGSPSKVQRVIKDVISLLFCAKKISHKSKKIWIQIYSYMKCFYINKNFLSRKPGKQVQDETKKETELGKKGICFKYSTLKLTWIAILQHSRDLKHVCMCCFL